jgi:hypothetical protein
MGRFLAGVFLSVSLLCGPAFGAGRRPARALTLDVTARQRVFTRELGRGLLLRVVKERSASREHFGWRLEVVRKPYRRTSRNLLYQNSAGHGADPSQVYAWHVAERHFPDDRELKVRGYPYTVRVVLADCRVEGRGPEAGFVSGELRITWERRP